MRVLKLTIIYLLVSNIYIYGDNIEIRHSITPDEAQILETANHIASTNYLSAASFLSAKLTQNSSPPMFFSAANFYFRAEEYKIAQRLYLDTLQKVPNYIEVKKNLARLYLTTERFDDAKEVMLDLINFEPTNSDYYLFLGNAYMLSNFDTSAETAFRQCLMIDPVNNSAKLGLCKSLLNQGRYQEIIPIAKELLDSDAESQTYWLLLANVQIAEGHIFSALCSLETAKRLNCITPAMKMTLANIYLNENLSQNAVKLYTQLLKEHPDQLKEEQLKNIINVLLSLNRVDLADDIYHSLKGKGVISKEEDLKLQASLHVAKNQQEEAVEIYKSIIAINPIEAETLIAYARYLRENQLYDEAITTIIPVTRLAGYEAQALFLLTDIELERRNFELAVSYLENAMIFESSPATESYLRQIKKLLN